MKKSFVFFLSFIFSFALFAKALPEKDQTSKTVEEAPEYTVFENPVKEKAPTSKSIKSKTITDTSAEEESWGDFSEEDKEDPAWKDFAKDTKEDGTAGIHKSWKEFREAQQKAFKKEKEEMKKKEALEEEERKKREASWEEEITNSFKYKGSDKDLSLSKLKSLKNVDSMPLSQKLLQVERQRRQQQTVLSVNAKNVKYRHYTSLKIKPLSKKIFSYPYKARKQKIQGLVQVIYYVTPNGNVVYPKVYKSSGHRALDQAALKGVLNMRYYPNQSSWVIQPVKFVLNKKN